MKLFISVEASNSAAFIINDIRKIIENKMGKIEYVIIQIISKVLAL